MKEEEFRRCCAIIEERGVEGFDAEVNLAVMAIAEAVVDGRLRYETTDAVGVDHAEIELSSPSAAALGGRSFQPA